MARRWPTRTWSSSRCGTLSNTGFDFIGLANGEGAESRPPEVFGGADPAAAASLVDLWLDVFNTATLPFYWAGLEPVRGRPDTERLLTAARWFRERGVSVKGHPLVWRTLAPKWLLDSPEDEIEDVLRSRVRREVSSFGGLVDTWDVVNEAVIMPVFDNEERQNAVTRLCRRIGRIATIRLAVEEARATRPGLQLVLNDFNMSTAYECLIEGVLEAGLQIDAIGLQSHMHQGYWGEERTLEVLDRFARYGLRHYRTLLSHPSVDRSRTGGSPTVAHGSARPAGWCAPMGRPSPHMTRCVDWSSRSGGWSPPASAPTGRDVSP